MLRETARERQYRYTGITAEELARRELEPGQRREQQDLRRTFRDERAGTIHDLNEEKQALEQKFSRDRQELRQEFEQQKRDQAHEHRELRRGVERDPTLSERWRARFVNELEDQIKTDKENLAREQQGRMAALRERQHIRLSRLPAEHQQELRDLETRQQERMNNLLASQAEERQAAIERYENVVAVARRGYARDSDSDQLSLPSDSENYSNR